MRGRKRKRRDERVGLDEGCGGVGDERQKAPPAVSAKSSGGGEEAVASSSVCSSRSSGGILMPDVCSDEDANLLRQLWGRFRVMVNAVAGGGDGARPGGGTQNKAGSNAEKSLSGAGATAAKSGSLPPGGICLKLAPAVF